MRVFGHCLAVLAAFVVAGASEAREIWRSENATLEFSAHLREILQVSEGTDRPAFDRALGQDPNCVLAQTFSNCSAFGLQNERDTWKSLTRLRSRFDLTVGSNFSAHLVYDNEFEFGVLDTLENGLGSGIDDSFLGLENDLITQTRKEWRHLLYRAYLSWHDEKTEVNVGRQRIAWGVGRLWNPIDRFNAVPPLAIEGDQSPGVDALDVRWLLSGFTYLQAVYAPETHSEDARYALRLHGVLRDVDYSLMAGVFDEAPTVGFDLAGNFRDWAVRTEVVYTDPRRDVWRIGDSTPRELSPFFEVVVSADYNFDIGTGLYFLAEHFYNGNALGFGENRAGPLLSAFESTAEAPPGLSPAQVAALGGPFVTEASVNQTGGSRALTRSRHTTGVMAGYDLTIALRGELLVLYDWNRSSAAFAPNLTYKGWDRVELNLGAQYFTGRKHSAFGSEPPQLFFIANFYY